MTDERRLIFLAAMRDGNSVAYASAQAGITRTTAYRWRNADEAFKSDWDDAVEHGTDGLEDEAIRRAKSGSDVLLIFMLKARRRDTYADLGRVHISGPKDGPIQLQAVDERPAIESFLGEFTQLEHTDVPKH